MCIHHGYSSLCGHHTKQPIPCGIPNCHEERLWSTKTHCDTCWSYLSRLQLNTATEAQERTRFKNILLQLRERDRVHLGLQFNHEERLARHQFWGGEGGFAYAGPLPLGSLNPRFNENLYGYYELEKAAEERRFLELIDIAKRDKLLEQFEKDEVARREVGERSMAHTDIAREIKRLQRNIDEYEKQQREEEVVRLLGERRRKEEMLRREFEERTEERKKVLARLLRLEYDEDGDNEHLEGYLHHAYPEDYPRDYVKQKRLGEEVERSMNKNKPSSREEEEKKKKRKRRSPEFKPTPMDIDSSSDDSDGGGGGGKGNGNAVAGGSSSAQQQGFATGSRYDSTIRWIQAVDEAQSNGEGSSSCSGGGGGGGGGSGNVQNIRPSTGSQDVITNADASAIVGGWRPRPPPPADSSSSTTTTTPSTTGHTSKTSISSDTTDIYDPKVEQLAQKLANFRNHKRMSKKKKRVSGRGVQKKSRSSSSSKKVVTSPGRSKKVVGRSRSRSMLMSQLKSEVRAKWAKMLVA